ncbi:unnamed protein product [Rotaria magnacalcarata]|uniref:Uncharacterized protein n=1 Tax=Rotaria magnacalcarata TaxID=392030 RepID=A0A8S2K1A7_9BILA|nr:unnamed protein product [Rotaria magnacalcarata]CAF3884225.1 unnamed protein product [Rotaria magnacalcarata]CAF3904412.1 unnamed protein product [Rotaria magnacalcarata]
MDEFDIALEYARKKKRNRFNKNNARRCNARSKFNSKYHDSDSLDIEQYLIDPSVSVNSSKFFDVYSNKLSFLSYHTSTMNLDEQIIQSHNDHQSNIESNDLVVDGFVQDTAKYIQALHSHTSLDSFSFSKNLISFIRKANISKQHTEHLIGLIQSGLPQPNNLPTNYSALLSFLSVEDLFIKRTVCINCKVDLPTSSKTCSKCNSNKSHSRALIFDAMHELVFTQIYDRLHTIMNAYRDIFKQQTFDDENNDVVYNQNYKLLCDSTDDPFISIILHLDGVSLSKSNKQPMWILSCSFVELPPIIRNRRQNNLILSIWVGKKQPYIELWLSETIKQLKNLKSKDKATEIRNFMLYCILPMMRNFIDCDRFAHLALFVIGIRLLHGRRVFGEETASKADILLTTFYRDHELFYRALQDFALHLHMHFGELYQKHGSLCNVNTFSQEDIMGAVSKYKHGSRFWGDQIVFYLNIDFTLKNIHHSEDNSFSIAASERLFDITSVPEDLIEMLPDIHRRVYSIFDMVGIQGEKRVRRPRKVFSPSDKFTGPTHYLLYFDSTDSYNIALYSSIKHISGDTATVIIRGKKLSATIIIGGTLSDCEDEQRKRTRESQQRVDSNAESNDSDTESINLSSSHHGGTTTSIHLPRVQQTALTTNNAPYISNCESDYSVADTDSGDEDSDSTLDSTESSNRSLDMNTKSTINKRKRTETQTSAKPVKRQRKNNQNNDIEQVEASVDPVIVDENIAKSALNYNLYICSNFSLFTSAVDITECMEKTLVTFQNSMINSFQKIEKKISCHLRSNLTQNLQYLEPYKTDQNVAFPTEYVVNGINLLDTLSKDPIDFSRRTLKLLFSKEELKTHLLPPNRDYLRRESLDQERFNKLLEAVRIKFRLDSNRMQQFYHDVLKTKLANFLYEERRREDRRRQREQKHISKEGTSLLNPNGYQQRSDDDEEEITHSLPINYIGR